MHLRPRKSKPLHVFLCLPFLPSAYRLGLSPKVRGGCFKGVLRDQAAGCSHDVTAPPRGVMLQLPRRGWGRRAGTELYPEEPGAQPEKGMPPVWTHRYRRYLLLPPPSSAALRPEHCCLGPRMVVVPRLVAPDGHGDLCSSWVSTELSWEWSLQGEAPTGLEGEAVW